MDAGTGRPLVKEAIKSALARQSATELDISGYRYKDILLTVTDTRLIFDCLRQNPRFNTLKVDACDISNPAVLNAIRVGLPLCTSLTAVKFSEAKMGNEELDRILPALLHITSTSVTSLNLSRNTINGTTGRGELLRDLLFGNKSLGELPLCTSLVCARVASGLRQGLAGNNRLQKLCLIHCSLGSEGLASLLPAASDDNDGMINMSLIELDLSGNKINGAEDGQTMALLLRRLPALKILRLNHNWLGPLGARALSPSLLPSASSTTACRLESLHVCGCRLGNDGVANLIPDGMVNRSLIHLDLRSNVEGVVSEENVIALAARCTSLESIDVDEYNCRRWSSSQRQRLYLILDRKRLCMAAQALAGSTFSVLFRAVEKAHRHEHGLSAIFVILQNDGEDHFCNANNRSRERGVQSYWSPAHEIWIKS
jgi:Leucine Rich repeat